MGPVESIAFDQRLLEGDWKKERGNDKRESKERQIPPKVPRSLAWDCVNVCCDSYLDGPVSNSSSYTPARLPFPHAKRGIAG